MEGKNSEKISFEAALDKAGKYKLKIFKLRIFRNKINFPMIIMLVRGD